jgi:hypothetical protein
MSDRLLPDQQLRVGHGLAPANGEYELTLQADGNLVLYGAGDAPRPVLWASNTERQPVERAVLQQDGNFVVYRRDGTPAWASGTEGHPRSRLVLQDDGNLVVYDCAGRPLWATATNQAHVRTGFVPDQHGFHFDNDFVNVIATLPGFGQITTSGRCGGMSYTALDHFHADLPIPAQRAADFAPATVPADHTPLADYIYRRQLDSLRVWTARHFITWTLASDHATPLAKGVTRWTKDEEIPKLRHRLDAGTPCVLGLVKARKLADIGTNHQVVACGYDYQPATDTLTIQLYDNRYHDRTVTLTTTRDDPRAILSGPPGTEDWRGFFVHDYNTQTPQLPPQPNPPA